MALGKTQLQISLHLTRKKTYLSKTQLTNIPSSSRLFPRPQKPYNWNSSIYSHNMDTQMIFTMAPPLAPDTYMQLTTSPPLYPMSYGFIERHIKTTKTALTTTKAFGDQWKPSANTSCASVEILLLNIHLTPIGPHMPSPQVILHNRTKEFPWQVSKAVDFEDVQNYFIAKKATQKEYHCKRQTAVPLPELYPGQDILFLSPDQPNTYILSTMISPAPQPGNYILKS